VTAVRPVRRAATTEPGIRHVERVMGTVVSIDIRTPLAPHRLAAAVVDLVGLLHEVDRAFSTYRDDSWVCRLARGEVRLADCPADVVEVYALAEACRVATGGAFDPGYRGDGTLDPTGLVKGWVTDRASALLVAAGAVDHCVNAAGDVRARGHRAPGQPWRVGIADPHRPGGLVGTVTGTDLAVATSGTAERGAHVIDPRTGAAADGLAAVTVIGPDLARADAYATAGLALGGDAPSLLDRLAADGWRYLTVP
jgi:thiamine biosynthesis lipoprotein